MEKSRNTKLQKRMALTLLCTFILIVLWFALNTFIIGEPVDGSQMFWTASVRGQSLVLQVENRRDSAMALRGWQFRRAGGTLSISARKVVVSPLFPSGTYETTIDLNGVTDIYLGGRKIWPEEGEGR